METSVNANESAGCVPLEDQEMHSLPVRTTALILAWAPVRKNTLLITICNALRRPANGAPQTTPGAYVLAPLGVQRLCHRKADPARYLAPAHMLFQPECRFETLLCNPKLLLNLDGIGVHQL